MGKIIAEDLANTKIRVTPEQSAKVQELAFSLGYEWLVKKVVQYLEAPFLFFDGSDDSITHSSDSVFFKNDEFREIHYTDLFPEASPQPEAITPEGTQNVLTCMNCTNTFNELDSGCICPGCFIANTQEPEVITPEALEREPGWKKIGPALWSNYSACLLYSSTTGKVEMNHPAEIICKGVSTMPELRLLCTLINGTDK